jgi:hypothetical protein
MLSSPDLCDQADDESVVRRIVKRQGDDCVNRGKLPPIHVSLLEQQKCETERGAPQLRRAREAIPRRTGEFTDTANFKAERLLVEGLQTLCRP